MSTPQTMDFESGPSPSQNADPKQELNFLRAEIVKLQGELIEAKKYEEKYHQVVEEVNRLRERLRCTPPRATPEKSHSNGEPHQLETPKPSPGKDLEKKPFKVKRGASPIRVDYSKRPIMAKVKEEKVEEKFVIDKIMGSSEERADPEIQSVIKPEDVADTLAFDGENNTSPSWQDLQVQTSRRQPGRKAKERMAISVKRETSVIVISSDDEALPPSQSRLRGHPRSGKSKPSTLELPQSENEDPTASGNVLEVEVSDAPLVLSSRSRTKTQQSTPKIKKEEENPDFFDDAIFKPIQGILNSYPRAELSPAQLANRPVPRELVSHAWGGGTQIVEVRTGKEKRRDNEKAGRLVVEEYVGLSRIWNPRLPQQPGDHGVTYAPLTITEPLPLFVREAAWNWRYLGHYTIEQCPREFQGEACLREFNGELWDRLPHKTKRVWLHGFVTAGWGYRARRIIHLWRELGRSPTKEEIDKGSKIKIVVTEDEVDKALSEKHIHLDVYLTKFHYYSDEHYESLISCEEEEDYLEKLESAKKQSKPEGKVQKKRKEPDSPRKTQKSKRNKRSRENSEGEDQDQDQDQDSVGESDDEYTPAKRRGAATKSITPRSRRR